MESEIQQHQTNVQMVLAPPEEVYAATDVTLKVKVSCPEKCDLQGGQVRISDGEGDVVKDVDLASFDGEANETDEFIVKMPVEPGSYTCTALFLPHESEEVQHEQSSAAFNFTVKAHQIFISVWGMPSPVIKGEKFMVKIGAKCSAGCSVAGLPFTIEDNNNKRVATGKLGEVVLPQTSDSYWSEQELVAPSEEGLCKWIASFITSDLELQHEVNPKQFTFYTANPPEHIVTVEVVDRSRKIPLKNASVFLNLRRASTDEHGMAKIEVTKGKHKLYVSSDHYEPFQTTIEVAGDVTVKAELTFSPDPYKI